MAQSHGTVTLVVCSVKKKNLLTEICLKSSFYHMWLLFFLIQEKHRGVSQIEVSNYLN